MQTVLASVLALALYPAAAAAQGLAEQRYSRPALFTENAGQWDEAVRFRSFGASHTLLFTKDGLAAVRRDARGSGVLPDRERRPVNPYPSVSFVRPSKAMRTAGGGAAAARFNYYRGSDTSRWRTDVRSYGEVRYADVWKDVDVTYTIARGALRQTIDIGPDGDPRDVRFASEGGGIVMRLLGAETENGRPVTAELVETDGVYALRAASAGSSQHRYFRTEYSFEFGGERDDAVRSICVDRVGNVVTAGTTESERFPVKNNQYADMDYSDFFFAKFDCDGGMVYGTYLGGSGAETDVSIVQRRDGAIAMAGYLQKFGDTAIFPITTTALERSSNLGDINVLAVIANNGHLEYGSFGPPAHAGAIIAIDTCDNIYLTYDGYGLPAINKIKRYFTIGTIFEREPRSTTDNGILIKLAPGCDSVLFGTHLCDSAATMNISSLGVAPDGCPVVAGFRSGGATFPAGKHFGSADTSSRSQAFIMKLKADGSDYHYCTTISGKSVDTGYYIIPMPHAPAFDHEGNVHITGYVTQQDMPVVAPLRSWMWDSMDGFVATFDTAGSLVYSTYTGGLRQDQNDGLALDECGNRFIISENEGGNGIYTPIDTSLDSATSWLFLTVLNAGGDRVLLSTPWGKARVRSSSTVSMGRNIVIDDNGYVYLSGRSSGIPIVNPRDTSIAGEQKEAFLTRLFLPYCNQDYVRCEVALPRELRFERSRRVPVPASFPVTVTVRNSRADRPALDVAVELVLPKGLALDPPAQPLTQQLSPSTLDPGASRQLTWTVRVDTSLYGDSAALVSAVAVFRNPMARSQCPLPFSRSDSALPIRYETIPAPEVTCTLSAPDSVRADATGRRYADNPFAVEVRVTNNGNAAAALRRVALRLPKGMGLSTVPPNDTVRLLPPLAPLETRMVSWQVTASGMPAGRVARMLAAVVDTFGVDASVCDRVLALAGLTSLDCALRSTDTVRYDTTARVYVPSPFPVTLDLRRTVDTVVMAVEAEVDLSSAPHLRLAAGDTLRKTLAVIYSHEAFSLSWSLEAVPPIPWPCTEMIAVRYRAAGWIGWERCEKRVALVPPPALVSCRLTIPAVADSQGVYVPDPLPVEYELQNGGAGLLQPRTAVLTVTPPIMTSLDSLARVLSDLAPGTRRGLRWRLHAPTSRFARSAAVLAVTRDSLGIELTRCGGTLVLPPIVPDLHCSLATPDTLHYDLPADTYTPDPLPATLTFANVLDTAQAAIETELDLTAAPHLTLDAGETAGKTLDSIPAHAQAALNWRLAVALRSDSAIVERVTVRYRHAGDSAVAGGGWHFCSKDIVIEGGKRIAAASCSTSGHDTLWADVAYEDVIPHPVQVQYTIANTGTVPLAACTAAIVHPPALTLVNPADSIQDYGTIPPGTSVAREWLLELNQSQAQPGAMQLSWDRGCLNLAGDSACTHRVTLRTGPPPGIVLSPWLLRFRAERLAALPAPQSVTLWTAGALAMPWQLQPSATWLDVQPLAGSTKQSVSVQPNTTDLQDGVYPATIGVASSAMVAPPRVDVIYEIGTLNAVDAPALPDGIELESPYPNPAHGTANVAFTIATARAVQLTLYDIYGRRVATLAEGRFAAGRHAVHAELSMFPAGVYVCVLNAGGACATRRLALRR